MGMSTNIIGFHPPDETWLKMKSAYDACVAADIDVPDAIMEYFDWCEPTDDGVSVDLEPMLREWSNDYAEGYELDIDKLPKNIKVIRFYNSW